MTIEMTFNHRAQMLLDLAIAGKTGSLARLLELHRNYLRGLAHGKLGDGLEVRVDASDLAQQACLSAYCDFPQFKGKSLGEFVAWLKTIHSRNLHDAVREHVQAKQRTIRKEQRIDSRGELDCVGQMQLASDVPEQQRENSQSIASLLKALPQRQRQAVQLKYLEGYSLAQVAKAMNRSEAAVAGLLTRGMQTLRALSRGER